MRERSEEQVLHTPPPRRFAALHTPVRTAGGRMLAWSSALLRRAVRRVRHLLRDTPGVGRVFDAVLPPGAGEHRRRAYRAYREDRYEEAVTEFRRSLDLEDDDAGAWLGLARAHNRLRERSEAECAVRRALALDPDDAGALALLGDLLVKTGRDREAVALLGELGEVGASKKMLRVAADLFIAEDDLERASVFVGEQVRRGVGGAETLARLALLLHSMGHTAAADALVPPAPRAAVGRRLARTHYLCQTGRALQAFEMLDLDEEDDNGLLYEVGRALSRQGWLEEAVETFERILELDAADARARRALRRSNGELEVLSGRWRPPDVAIMRSEPGSARVLHVVGRSLPHALAGYTVRTQQVALAQRRVGLDPMVVTRLAFPWRQGESDAAVRSEVDGIAYRHVPCDDLESFRDPSWRLSRNTELLAEVVEELRPAALHAASDYMNATMAIALGARFGVPVVYEVRGFWEETWLSKQPFPDVAARSGRYLGRRVAETRCLEGADHLVTLADVMEDHIVARGIDPARITVVPNAVDTGAFSPAPRDPALAAQLGIDDGEVVVGYISSLVGYEGVSYLIDALVSLIEDGQRVRGLVVGDGPERPSLEHQVRAAGLDDRIHLVGRVPHAEVGRYYDLIDVFVVPRTPDRVCHLVTPLKPFEAMAKAKPVVVADLPALREIVQPGETGLTFPAGDADGLAEVLSRLVVSGSLRQELGQAAYRWVTRERTWDHVGERYREVYERLGVLSPVGSASRRQS